MKINYETIIRQLDGEPFTEPDPKGKPGQDVPAQRPLTLGRAIITVCSLPLPGDEALDPVSKCAVGEIAVCAHKGFPITAEQIATVKARAAKGYQSPVLVYLIHEALENPAPAEKPKK